MSPVRDRHLALRDGRLGDMVVEGGYLGKAAMALLPSGQIGGWR
jgi:hypothetical protein